MVQPGHIFLQDELVYIILSIQQDMVVYRRLGFPNSDLYQDTREKFELRLGNLEFKKIEGKIILEDRKVMVKPGHIFLRDEIAYIILSNTDGMNVYRRLGFPNSDLYQDTREKFELRVENLEFKKIEGKIILEDRNNKIHKLLYENKIYRNKNALYKIISNKEGMIVFRELGFPTAKLFQTSHFNFKKLIDNGKIQEREYKYVEVGDVYILARTNFTYEILSIDRNAMVIKRFFKGEWKICNNYGLYHFHRDVSAGKYILISTSTEKDATQH